MRLAAGKVLCRSFSDEAEGLPDFQSPSEVHMGVRVERFGVRDAVQQSHNRTKHFGSVRLLLAVNRNVVQRGRSSASHFLMMWKGFPILKNHSSLSGEPVKCRGERIFLHSFIDDRERELVEDFFDLLRLF